MRTFFELLVVVIGWVTNRSWARASKKALE